MSVFNFVKHQIILEHKTEIIKDYLNYVKVKDIAKKYETYTDIISDNLRKWNIPKRSKLDKGVVEAKDKPSPELLAQQAENSRWNKLLVKFYPYPHDVFLARYSGVK